MAFLLMGGLGAGPVWGQAGDPVPEPADPEPEVPDSVEDGSWIYEVTTRLNASQAAYRAWEEGGGNNSLAFTTSLRGEAAQRGEHWIQAHQLRLTFGLFNQEGQELRKAEDQIRWNSSLRYEGRDFFRRFNPTIAGILRTQFASGFDYSDNPYPEDSPRAGEEPPVENSAFFSPAFITESLGLTYEPARNFTIRLGAASKQTVVRERDFRVLYGVEADNMTRVEAGTELASSLDRNLTENVRYRSQVNVFFSFNQAEQPPDARWENTVNLEVNDWLSTDVEFVALFDNDITDAIQLKETISLGVSFTLI